MVFRRKADMPENFVGEFTRADSDQMEPRAVPFDRNRARWRYWFHRAHSVRLIPAGRNMLQDERFVRDGPEAVIRIYISCHSDDKDNAVETSCAPAPAWKAPAVSGPTIPAWANSDRPSAIWSHQWGSR